MDKEEDWSWPYLRFDKHQRENRTSESAFHVSCLD